MNKLLLMGRLVKDVEVKTSQSNKSFANFTIAVNREFADSDGERKADFFNCMAFGKTAENMARFFKKGSQVLIEGSVQIDTYEEKFYTKVMVNKFYFIDNKSTSQENTQVSEAQTPSERQAKKETYVGKAPVQETNFNEFDNEVKFDIQEEDLPF